MIALQAPVFLPPPVISDIRRPDSSNSICNAFALLRNIDLFETLAHPQLLIKAWRIDYNESRPHMALGNKTLAEYFFAGNPFAVGAGSNGR
jgi:transposase InsO family protein